MFSKFYKVFIQETLFDTLKSIFDLEIFLNLLYLKKFLFIFVLNIGKGGKSAQHSKEAKIHAPPPIIGNSLSKCSFVFLG